MATLMQRVRSALARFSRDERGGNTTVEFALIATPFFMLIFGVLELGLVFLVTTTLENATIAAGRKVRTGELQGSGGSASTFKAEVCNNMSWLGSSCSSNLYVDVRTFTSFSTVTQPSPVVGGVVDPASLSFTPGVGNDIVLVRSYYTWTIITPLLNASLVNLSGNKRLITTAVAFRNEPF